MLSNLDFIETSESPSTTASSLLPWPQAAISEHSHYEEISIYEVF
jgi:hypothetical protein